MIQRCTPVFVILYLKVALCVVLTIRRVFFSLAFAGIAYLYDGYIHGHFTRWVYRQPGNAQFQTKERDQTCNRACWCRYWDFDRVKRKKKWKLLNSRVDSDDRGMVVYNSCTNSVPGVCNCFPLFWSLLYLCICDVKHSQMGGTPAARAGKRKNLYQLVLIDCSYSRKNMISRFVLF